MSALYGIVDILAWQKPSIAANINSSASQSSIIEYHMRRSMRIINRQRIIYVGVLRRSDGIQILSAGEVIDDFARRQNLNAVKIYINY